MVSWESCSERIVFKPEGAVSTTLESTVVVIRSNAFRWVRDVLLEVLKVMKHAHRFAVVLEPHKARAILVVRKEDDAAMARRGKVLVLQVLELVAERGLLSVTSILTSLRAVQHIVAASEF